MFRSTVLALAGLAGLALSARPVPGNNYTGMNAGWLIDWDGGNASADILLHAREWQNAAWKDTVALDEDGWPKGDASTVVFFTGNDSGTYHLRFTGSAEAVQVMWQESTVDSVLYDAATNTTTARIRLPKPVVGSGGVVLVGTRRTPSSPKGSGFTNAQLWRPGYPTDGSQPFTREYLALMSGQHVTRFMDWGVTNVNPVRTWAQRRRPNAATNMRPIDGIDGEMNRGMPIELMVALCNATRTDMWINMPARADSQYVVNAMKTILNGSDGNLPYETTVPNPVHKPLDPDLKVYVEYGNEIWNHAWGFRCGSWFNDIYVEEAKGKSSHPIYFDGTTDEWIPFFRFFGHMSLRMSRAVRAAVGDDRMMTRFRPVIQGQLGFEQMLSPALDYIEHTAGSVKAHFWGGGGTAYYGANEWATTPDAFFAAGNAPQQDFATWLENDAVLLANYGLKRVAYEGGLGMDDGANTATEAERWAINLDPRMTSVIEKAHDMWSSYGGDLLVYFTITGHPNFAFTDSWKNAESAKLKALRDLAARPRAATTIGCVAPCTTYAWRSRTGVGYGYRWFGTAGKDSVLAGFDPGEWSGYAVTAPRDGRYLLSARVSSSAAGRGALWVNGTPVDSFDIPDGISETLIQTPPTRVDLQAGMVGLRIASLSGMDFAVNSLILVPDPTFVSVSPAPHASARPQGPQLPLLDQIRYRIHAGRVHGLDGKRH